MLLAPAHCPCVWLYFVLPTPCTPFIMFDVLMFAWSSFCIPVAPSSMLFMCLLLRAVFNFGWLPLIKEVLAEVKLHRFEIFKYVCLHAMCLNFGRTP